MESTIKNTINKQSVRDKLNHCEPMKVFSPCTYDEALKIVKSDPIRYDCTVFPIIRRNKDDDGKIVSTSIDLYVYICKDEEFRLIEKSEDEYDLNGDLINETKNPQAKT